MSPYPHSSPSSIHPASSPLRSSSKRSKSDHHTPPPSAQADLQKRLFKELRDHTWQFDAERIAEMLSATGEGPTKVLVDSAHRALGKKQTPQWPMAGEEPTWYPPLTAFLNNCVGACHDALRTSKSAAAKVNHSRFYDLLKFITYNKTAEDSVDGAARVKPDLVGGMDLAPGDRVAWSPQDARSKQVLLPVEVKGDWTPMVSQAATYARCLFSVSPSRQFAVVLGFRHGKRKDELRFLVFHRGGLTGSHPLSVKDEPGQKDILRILLSILNWGSAKDAGFPEYYNDFEMSLLRRKGDKDGVVARVVEVLHDGLCVQGRASRALLMRYPVTGQEKELEPSTSPLGPSVQTRRHPGTKTETEQREPHVISVMCPSSSASLWSSPLETRATNGNHAYVVVKHSWCEDRRHGVEAELLATCKDDFGTPDHHYSFCPTDTRGVRTSTARFLPTDGERLEDFHWAIIPDSKVPSIPQRRYLWIHVSKLVGQSLVHAKTPWELYLAIGHAMLGWLAMLRKGFLHRDISIGNTLMLDPPVTTKPFEVLPTEQLMLQLSLRHDNDLTKYAKLLEDVIKEMGYLDKCHGFVIDGDMAANLEDHFTSRDTGEASGTYEFMSNVLADTLWSKTPKPHLHSPVDDLESFYYTAQWAAAFNDGASGGRHDGIEIQDLREMISGDRRERATNMVREERLSPDTTEYGPFLTRSLYLLTPWQDKLGTLIRDWNRVMRNAASRGDEDKKEYLRLNFLVYSYRGVGEYLELVHKHRELLHGAV